MKCCWCWAQNPRGTWREVRSKGETLYLCLDCQYRGSCDRSFAATIEGMMAYWVKHYSPRAKARAARRRQKRGGA